MNYKFIIFVLFAVYFSLGPVNLVRADTELDDPAWVYYAKGNYHRSRRNYGMALTMYYGALTIDPNFKAAKYALVDYFLNEHTDRTSAKTKYIKVKDLLDELIGDKEKNFEEDNELAYLYYLNAKNTYLLERRDEALELCRKALGIKSDFFEPWMFMGYVYMKEKNWKLAIEHFTHLMLRKEFQENPDIRAYWSMAKCFEQTGQLQKAFKSYREIIRIDYDNQQTITYLLKLHQGRTVKNDESVIELLLDIAEYFNIGEGKIKNKKKVAYLVTIIRQMGPRSPQNIDRLSKLKK